ncbi:MAG: hypothetical protein ACI865_001827 [Flavobacteriaceae bacterium]|jgi:hypothetical protein
MGCSKQDRVQKKLSGVWHITEYKYHDLLGFNYYPEVSGELFFENCNGGQCAYSLSINYVHPAITGSRTEAGSYLVNNQAGLLFFTPIINGIQEAPREHEILLLTKEDAQLRHTDSNGYTHQYLFER